MKIGDLVTFHEAAGTTVEGQATECPAIVTVVNDDETLNITVFHDSAPITYPAHVGHNDKTGTEQYGWSDPNAPAVAETSSTDEPSTTDEHTAE